MSSDVQSPLFTIIALSLSAVGLVIVGVVSGLIPGVYPATSGAREEAMQVEAKAEASGANGAVIRNLVGTATANPGAATDPAVNTAVPPTLMAGADSKNP